MGFLHYADREARDERARELRAQGLTLRAIADILGCHQTTVWEAVNLERHSYWKMRRRERNTSPEGLERQRQYRAKRAK